MRSAVLRAARRSGVLRGLRRAFGPNSLAVLCYHRIADPGDGLFRFGPMVGADPAGFEAHLRWIARHHHVVTLDQAVDWITGRDDLPAWPLLITFDDGYRDNATLAGPLLARFGLPATLFLTTGILDGGGLLWWDRVVRCFELTGESEVDLPLVGRVRPTSGPEPQAAMIEALKRMPEEDKLRVLDDVAARLGVGPSACTPGDLYLDWDTVRRMQREGWSFGAHTISHPILTKVGPGAARREMAHSKERIEAELGAPVRALAYPNGQPGDFDPLVRQIAIEVGFEAAFSLVPGPTRVGEAQRDPFAVRRITIHHKDSPARFAAKLSGLSRLIPSR